MLGRIFGAQFVQLELHLFDIDLGGGLGRRLRLQHALAFERLDLLGERRLARLQFRHLIRLGMDLLLQGLQLFEVRRETLRQCLRGALLVVPQLVFLLAELLSYPAHFGVQETVFLHYPLAAHIRNSLDEQPGQAIRHARHLFPLLPFKADVKCLRRFHLDLDPGFGCLHRRLPVPVLRKVVQVELADHRLHHLRREKSFANRPQLILRAESRCFRPRSDRRVSRNRLCRADQCAGSKALRQPQREHGDRRSQQHNRDQQDQLAALERPQERQRRCRSFDIIFHYVYPRVVLARPCAAQPILQEACHAGFSRSRLRVGGTG